MCSWKSKYESLCTGRYLYRIGVTPLEDMLSETAFVKLSWILAQTTDLNEVKKSHADQLSWRD